jgi:hypothetical protein
MSQLRKCGCSGGGRELSKYHEIRIKKLGFLIFENCISSTNGNQYFAIGYSTKKNLNSPLIQGR